MCRHCCARTKANNHKPKPRRKNPGKNARRLQAQLQNSDKWNTKGANCENHNKQKKSRPPWSAFTIQGQHRTYHASRFIFISFFFFNFSVCSVWWTNLATRQLFYCTLNTQYRIVSYPECHCWTRNLAIANRSRNSCAHNASIVTPWPWNIG